MIGAALSLVAAGAAAHGAYHRNSPVFGTVLGALPPGERVVALTFDDGPNRHATPAILDILAQYDVPATFFVLGRHADRWPAIVRDAAAAGHEIANHGWHHEKLHVRGPSFVRGDVTAGMRSLQRAADVSPRLFRAPHGFRSPWVTAIARSLGQRTVGWSLGVWDSARPGAEAIARRAVDGARPGSIILLHDGDGYDASGDRMQTAGALALMIPRLRDAGYRFARIA